MENFKALSSDELELQGSGLVSGIAGTIIGVCVAAPVAVVITYACGGGEKETKAAALAAASTCMAIGAISPLP